MMRNRIFASFAALLLFGPMPQASACFLGLSEITKQRAESFAGRTLHINERVIKEIEIRRDKILVWVLDEEGEFFGTGSGIGGGGEKLWKPLIERYSAPVREGNLASLKKFLTCTGGFATKLPD